LLSVERRRGQPSFEKANPCTRSALLEVAKGEVVESSCAVTSAEVNYVVAPSETRPKAAVAGSSESEGDKGCTDMDPQQSCQDHAARGLRLLASDGVHPNEVGYRLWGHHIADNLNDVLKTTLLERRQKAQRRLFRPYQQKNIVALAAKK